MSFTAQVLIHTQTRYDDEYDESDAALDAAWMPRSLVMSR